MSPILCIFLAVASPLQSAADYIFSDISNREWLVGSSIGIMGVDGAGGRPAAGEDVIYLNEAAQEIRQIADSTANSERVKAGGNVRPYPILDVSRAAYSPYSDIHGLLADSTNAARSICGGIVRAEWTPPDGGGGLLTPSNGVGRYARSVVHWNFGTVTLNTLAALEPLALRRSFALVSTNVAAFYRALAEVNGVAFDRTVTSQGTIGTTYLDVGFAASCGFYGDTKDFKYSTSTWTNEYALTGCRAVALTVRSTSVMWAYSDGSSYVSSPMQGGSVYECSQDDRCAAQVFGVSLADPDALGVMAAWVIYRCEYAYSEKECTGMGQFTDKANVSTNLYLAVRHGSVTMAAEGGKVLAKVQPDMAEAVRELRSAVQSEGWKMPADIGYPDAPTWQGRADDDTGTLTSTAEASYDIRPYAVALILRVDWHFKNP